MTARPFFSRSRRKSVHFAISLCIVIVASLLVAGCISQPKNVTQPGITTSGVTGSPSDVIPVQIQCPPLSSNVSPYIIINPVGHFTFGDSIEINGSTNIGYNKKIQYVVIPAAVPVPAGVPVSRYYHLLPQGDVRITGGDCTSQAWSFMLDSTNLTWTGGLYIGTDNLMFPNGTLRNNVGNITYIRVHQANGGPLWGEIG
jgi:hypothetical protein